jgi:glycosyltransferase involved in cell wall biosynthesis
MTEHCFVVPRLDGPISGGTCYNRQLLAEFAQRAAVCACELASPKLADALQSAGAVWVDSLYLDRLPELRPRTRGRLVLIVHYLPSFVALERRAVSSELSGAEQRALAAADAFLVPSAFMRDALEALVAPTQKSIFVVEPGTSARLRAPRAARGELDVVLIGNVVEGKGLLGLLRALACVLAADDALALSVVGRLDAEPAYAQACQKLVAETPMLAERVQFLGMLKEGEALARLARADLFVSASRMESYGMALNEARVVGVPILARAGGNAAAHVVAEAGGALLHSDDALAQACVALARSPELMRERSAAARAHAVQPRAWARAAEELLAQLATWEK